ncbi:putative bifunctional diguanylate cyclase/phosphodiesterase [Marinicella sediminis]|uniref:Bifunctional diguanylate cyclase/phosphodiesterase n=1 Tax=Marinicella sediminis TaxID=1792834 RepID=A0ABV7J9C4_9GAMM|nr:bifunctional diguanylate cyclase/phosphodiesterase [Marinicella sediminis]
MSFHDHNVLIACSDKKDRLQFFNYFDDLDAEKIYTASDVEQMHELLAENEEQFTILAFEISSQWIKNLEKINQIKNQHPELKLIALVAMNVNLTPRQHGEIEKMVDGMFYSPVTQQELLAKGTAQVGERESVTRIHSEELEAFLNVHFQLTSLPKLLVEVDSHKILQANEAMLQQFDVKGAAIRGLVWHEISNIKKDKEITRLKSQLNEAGQLNKMVLLNFGHGYVPVNLYLYSVVFDNKTYYLAELFDQTKQQFQQMFLRFLNEVTRINFTENRDKTTMQNMLRWVGFEFCFIVQKELSDQYNQKIWDVSLNNYVDHFVQSNHDFINRKLAKDQIFDVREQANKKIPADEFLNFYGVSSLVAYNCSVDDQSQSVLVAGGMKPVKNWDSVKLLFHQMALHFKQTMAFKALKKSHESESQYDVLTELMNRRYIVKTIEQSIDIALKKRHTLAVMFLDLDRFKVINDSLGHDVGDDVLVSIANILKKNVKNHGVAARYAGDEFLILLNQNISKSQVNQIAETILKDVANPIKLKNGSEINLTISLGIAYFPEHGTSVNKLIKHADIALYNAKLNGKNRYTVYSEELDGDQAKQSEEMVRNLQAAIELDQIEVYYQPKINASTEDIMGFEALVRWEHPELGIISPGLFIPLAEQSELIFPIGLLVIEKACRALKQWQEQFKLPLTMSVNLSPIQLNDKDLIKKINRIIEETAVYPKHLDFEITESEKFKSVKDALLMFKKIVNLGCTLSIDDFGTGHSTLDYLRKIPAKTLKIDQVFVKNIGLSPDDEAILDATIDMAKRVGHFIVAEGVETEEQRQYLTSKGCDYFQGYLFSRPVPASEIDRILTDREKILKKN